MDVQLSIGYESQSGFRDFFSPILGAAPTKINEQRVLKATWIDTPLGPMIAIANEDLLFLLEFLDCRGLEREIERLRKKLRSAIIPGQTEPIHLIKKELEIYFKEPLINFKTPIYQFGTEFQKLVWAELLKIPYGETRSYAEQASAIGKPSAFRAVAQANGANQFAIVVPCHRIINTNGEIGGYGGGIMRKKWLLEHERKLKVS